MCVEGLIVKKRETTPFPSSRQKRCVREREAGRKARHPRVQFSSVQFMLFRFDCSIDDASRLIHMLLELMAMESISTREGHLAGFTSE
jgi:hypothetical protein